MEEEQESGVGEDEDERFEAVHACSFFPFLNRCVRICVSRERERVCGRGRFIKVYIRFKKIGPLLKLEKS